MADLDRYRAAIMLVSIYFVLHTQLAAKIRKIVNGSMFPNATNVLFGPHFKNYYTIEKEETEEY